MSRTIRERVLTSKDRFWRPEDFEGSPFAIEKTLSRLVATGDLRRVRRGLYWRGAATPLGMAPPKAEQVVGEITGSLGVGPASQDAARSLGLSTQIPRVTNIAVPGRSPRSVAGVKLVSRPSSRREERLLPLEVALLEVLRDWDRMVETNSGDAVDRIQLLMASGEISSHRLARAARNEPARVRDRLRHLLIELGFSQDANRIPPSRNARIFIGSSAA